MEKKILTTPISDEAIRSLTIGDTIYVSGTLITGRDAVHQRLLVESRDLSVDLTGNVLYHAGPIMKEREDAPGEYEVPLPSGAVFQEEKA